MPKFDLNLHREIVNAAGTLGFFPSSRCPIEITSLGAFITNPVSMAGRSPAHGTRIIDYPGGYLLHTGLINPGIRNVIHKYSPSWKRSPIPIWVHLLFQDINELIRMLKLLDETPGISGVELGLPPHVEPEDIRLLEEVSFEFPTILQIPLDRIFYTLPALTDTFLENINAISFGPPRGALPDQDGSLAFGRLYGPGLFPTTLAALIKTTELGIPTIAACGIYTQQQVDYLIELGAIGVQLDIVLWRGTWPPIQSQFNAQG